MHNRAWNGVKRLSTTLNVNEMQFGFMHGKGTIDTVFILRRMQEEYHAKGKKLHICIVDLEKAFGRAPRNVLKLVIRKEVIPEVSDRLGEAIR